MFCFEGNFHEMQARARKMMVSRVFNSQNDKKKTKIEKKTISKTSVFMLSIKKIVPGFVSCRYVWVRN